MSIRTIIFCDICNPQGVRSIEYRRAPRHDTSGRRITDGRSSYHGSVFEAIENAGWIMGSDGEHICHICKKAYLEKNLEQARS